VEGQVIYIPDVLAGIERLKPKWEKGSLTQKELNDFNFLLDEVVREARKTRSFWVEPDQKPEEYLLKLLRERIESTVIRFFKRYPEVAKEQSAKSDWVNNAIYITRTIILGDATKRYDRRKEIKPFIDTFTSSEEKHLHLNYKPIKAHRDALLGQVGTHKKAHFMDEIKNPDALAREERRLREFSRRGPSTRLKDFEGPGFIIKDKAAIEAAEQRACAQGIGYDPDYREKKLRELSLKEALAINEKKRWRKGEYKDKFSSEASFNAWLENKLIGGSLDDLKKEIKTTRKGNPNLINFLFGNKATKYKGKLYYRLIELYKFRKSRTKREILESKLTKGTRRDGKIPESKKEESLWLDEIGSVSRPLFSQRNSLDEAIDFRHFRQKLKEKLTNKQKDIYRLYHIEGYTPREISEMLGNTRQNIYKHIKKIHMIEEDLRRT
jgi:RNA polymerase sigma factor (sigma-70 family)